MIKDKNMPIYLHYPVFQILYIILWLPIGFVISNVICFIVIKIVYSIMSTILGIIFSYAFEMFLFSGRMQAIVEYFYYIIVVVFDLILLVVGLEIISHFLVKKRIVGGYNEQSNNK